MSEHEEPLTRHQPTSVTQHNLEVNTKHTPDGNNFKRGYLNGRHDQRLNNYGEQRDRENRNATRGLLLGMGLTALLAIGLGLILVPRFWDTNEPSTVIFSDPTEEAEPTTEANPPTNDSVTTPPENNTTVIENNTKEIIREKETETQVPVPSNSTSQTETSQPTAAPRSPAASTAPATSETQLPTAPENGSANPSPAAASDASGSANPSMETEPANPNPQ
ncbi:MAG: hypothetical protein SAJ12_17500 [Jaaginema sp. PMC 1079.18]|nr:hypothetical protein [Jaaginema sp. PMC 1080.18]MEC4852778.1 hypothetical protein [Jaaginema sp. PMC 1079.18]MEC4867422.1 hypothetical protein [Jaaginema sp. PMC 1078.18]